MYSENGATSEGEYCSSLHSCAVVKHSDQKQMLKEKVYVILQVKFTSKESERRVSGRDLETET